jgi:N-methylhydantoinase B
MGLNAVTEAIHDLISYTGRRLRNRIRDMADGAASFTSYLDDDGLGGDPVPIRATVRVRGETLVVDFTGTGAETRGALNVPESALRATVYYAVKTLLDPELLPNSGMFECIDIHAESGTLVNPRFPAAVGARSITCNKIARALFGAFASLLPLDRAMASSHDIVPAIIFSGPRRCDDGSFVYLETIGGGMGARSDADGMEAIHVHLTNTSNLPVEALENEYSLLVDEYALVPDSGGAGRHRGGLGIARQIRATRDGVVFSVRSDGHVLGAPGLADGGSGGTARLLRNAGTAQEQELSSKTASITLAAGETIRLETPGGGGFGAPAERDPAALAADLRGGKTSLAKARQHFGDAVVARVTPP